MKKCPFCKAELQENARFCLYCMAQLDEKTQIIAKQKNNKRLLAVICAVILLLIAVVLTVSILDNSGEPEFSGVSVSLPVVESVSHSMSEASREESILTESTDSTDSDFTGEPSDSESDTGSAVSSDSYDNTSGSETSSPVIQEVKYIYRDATSGDEWGSISVENAITIIGVESPSSDGTYVIPDNIDGKRVIAIAMYAFSAESIKDTVKKVIVSESVKNIHNYAFDGCYNMTDIYLCGEAVAGSPLYFLPKLEKRKYTITMHASATCNDRSHRTYKSIYSYEEWIGHSIGIFEEWNVSE